MAESMRSIVRRPGGTLVVRVPITLVPGRDDAVITAIQAAPAGQVAAVLRELLSHGVQEQVLGTRDLGDEALDMSGLGMEL